MSRHDEPDLARLSDEILRYLRAHPQAADTVDGIVGWWLPRQRHDEAVDRVQDALDKLVVSGLLEKITLVECLADETRQTARSGRPAPADRGGDRAAGPRITRPPNRAGIA